MNTITVLTLDEKDIEDVLKITKNYVCEVNEKLTEPSRTSKTDEEEFWES